MDFAARKYRLIARLFNLMNEEKLDKIEKFLNKEIGIATDPYDELPAPIKKLLAQSKEDSAKSKVRPHKEVMADIRAKYNLS